MWWTSPDSALHVTLSYTCKLHDDMQGVLHTVARLLHECLTVS